MSGKKRGSAAGRLALGVLKSAIRISLLLTVLLFVIVKWDILPVWGPVHDVFNRVSGERLHVYDEAEVLPAYDRRKFDEYLGWIFKESDVDMRLVFVQDTGKKTIEELAAEKVDKLGIGGKSREERGVLFLYDMKGKKMRVEVGYGLEAYFPDAFVSYLTEEHTHAFFADGNVTVGLRLLVRLLHHRIREAVLGNAFDPTVIDVIRSGRHLSGGAGASKAMAIGGKDAPYLKGKLPEEESRRYYSPQATPEAVYEKYLEWMVAGNYDPQIGIFTRSSQQYMSTMPMSRAYFEYILMLEYNRQYKIDERGTVALMYFTDDPFVSPHFFVKDEKGWRMDIMAEVANTKNRVGGVFTWDYMVGDDVYTSTFADKLVKIRGYVRIRDGDNRQLPVREDVQKSIKYKAAGIIKEVGKKVSQARNKKREELGKTAGWTELHFAAAEGDLEKVRGLVGKFPVDVKNARGRTSLHEAAKRGHLEVVKYLADEGSDINHKGTDAGFAPLHAAAEYKQIEMIRLLLSRGAEVNIRNNWNQTPLWQASWQPWHRDSEVARVLYEHGAELNSGDYRGFTPLHMAAGSGHIPLMIFFLENGVDVNVRANEGGTPLSSAAVYGRLASVKFLLEHGADKNLKIGRSTAQQFAEIEGHKEVAQLLRQHRR